MFINMISSIIC